MNQDPHLTRPPDGAGTVGLVSVLHRWTVRPAPSGAVRAAPGGPHSSNILPRGSALAGRSFAR